MKFAKRLSAVLAVLAVLVVGGLYGFARWATAPLDLAPYQEMFHAGDEVQPGQVAVTFLGVSSLYITDGETNIMVDGFFTRSPLFEMLLGDLAPDEEAIDYALQRAGVTNVDAIFAVHAHYDHIMDTPVVAEKTGAVMLGDRSAANVAKGLGLADDRMVVVTPGKPYRFGEFEITFLESEHAPVPSQETLAGTINEPLNPPKPFSAWKTGTAWAVIISHKTGTFVVQGSAGFRPENLAGAKADAVFLGVGGLGSFDQDYINSYWAEFVEKPGVSRVYATHWDDFTHPLSQPLQAQQGPMFGVAATFDLLQQKRAAGTGPEIHLLQGFATVTPFD